MDKTNRFVNYFLHITLKLAVTKGFLLCLHKIESAVNPTQQNCRNDVLLNLYPLNKPLTIFHLLDLA